MDNDLWEDAQAKKREQQEKEAAFLAAVVALWIDYLRQLESLLIVIAEQAAQAAADGKPLNADQIRNLEASQLATLEALRMADEAGDQWTAMIEQEQRRAQADGGTDAGAMLTIALIMAGLLARFGQGFTVPGVLGQGAESPGGLLTGDDLRAALLSRVGEFIAGALAAIATTAGEGGTVPAAVGAALESLTKLGDVAAIIGSDQAALAYREALLAAYNNAARTLPIIGYRRVSKRDSRVCPACISLDGRIYGLKEVFSEHPRGRCIAVPVLEGQQGDPWQRGTTWLASQPADVQRSILGPKRFDLWKAGKFSLDDLAITDGDGGLKSAPAKKFE